MIPNLKHFFKSPEFIEAGIDESGRGPLIGRVYAAAVIIDTENEIHPLLNDSKKMTKKRRGIVREWIEDNCLWGVSYSDEKEIDKVNILQATQNAMHRALDELVLTPEFIIVDGNYFKRYISHDGDFISFATIEGGDAKYAAISAASVIAKEYHDEYIKNLVDKNPDLDEIGRAHV